MKALGTTGEGRSTQDIWGGCLSISVLETEEPVVSDLSPFLLLMAFRLL